MSNYNSLKATIDANIKQNGNQEITGQILNSVLNQMVTTLGAGYQFAGVATLVPATDPGTPDAKVFYIANGKGTYTNFGGLEVTEDEVVVLYWDSAWHKVATGIASQEKLSELEGKVDDVVGNDGRTVSVSITLLNDTWTSLPKVIPVGATITSIKKDGIAAVEALYIKYETAGVNAISQSELPKELRDSIVKINASAGVWTIEYKTAKIEGELPLLKKKVSTIENGVAKNSESISTLKSDVAIMDSTIGLSIVKDKSALTDMVKGNFGYYDKDGNIAGTSSSWRHSNKIKIDKVSSILIQNIELHDKVSYIAFFDNNGLFIESILGGSSVQHKDKEVILDEYKKRGARYVSVSSNGEHYSFGEQFVELTIVNSQVSNNAEAIYRLERSATGRYIHMSFDDVSNALHDLYKTSYVSLWEQPLFSYIRGVHDTYGAVFSLFVYDKKYSEYIPDDYNISNTPDSFKGEFEDASEWLKFGVHLGTSYNSVVNEIIRFAGSKSIDRCPRFDGFAGTQEYCKSVMGGTYGIKGLLCADDSRTSYYLKDDLSFVNTYLQNHGKCFEPILGLMMFHTLKRLEYISNIDTYISNLTDNEKIEMCFFTHEYEIYTYSEGMKGDSIRDNISKLFAWGVRNEYTFDFPVNHTYDNGLGTVVSKNFGNTKIVESISNRICEELGYSEEDCSSANFVKDNKYWADVNGTIGLKETGTPTNGRITEPISLEKSRSIVIDAKSVSTAAQIVVTNKNGNVIDTIQDNNIRHIYLAKEDCLLYVNHNTTTYGAFYAVKSATDGAIREMLRKEELPIMAPKQEAANTDDCDFNAETCTSMQIQDAFERLIESLPIPSRSTYAKPRYGNVHDVVGKDASDTYDIKSYVFTLRNRFAWKRADKKYAWKNGSAIVYTPSICPVVGSSVDGKTITSYNSENEQIVLGGVAYTRCVEDNIKADIIWTSSVGNSSATSLDAYNDKNVKQANKATWNSSTQVTYNGNVYVRAESYDYHSDRKATIVLWGNEHAAQSDPHEPSIILYRLAKDLCGNDTTNKMITFLKRYCKVVLLPCANPYGMNKWASNKREGRNNANNVNINRNYDTPFWQSYSGEAKGDYAGDQAETQYIMNLVDSLGADLAIDIHCLGYNTEANEGQCAYKNPTEINSKVRDTMLLFGIDYVSYGVSTPTTSNEGSAWIKKIGIAGGLIEMNAGKYATSYNGGQHTANILQADYTLLLNAIRMYYHSLDADFDLSKFEEK